MADVRRGTAAVFVAKLVFMVAGYALYSSLGHLLTTEQFGRYGVIFGVVSLLNMVVINGTIQTISRFVASTPGGEGAVRRKGFLYQTVFAGTLLGLFILAAPLIARFLRDDSLTGYLRVAMTITASYAFYAINVGYLNGRKQFTRQAGLDIFFAITKVSLIVLLVSLGWGIHGVIAGFATAALIVLVLSFPVAGFRMGGSTADFPVAVFVRYAVSVMAVAFLLNLVLTSDLLLVKRLVPEAQADIEAGLYTAAQSIARIPYYLMITASIVLFPMIASLSGNDRRSRLRRADISSRAMVSVLGLVAGMAALVLPVADRVVVILYPSQYAQAGPAFALLLVGMVLLTLVNLSVAMINGAGKPLVSVGLLGGCLAVQVVGASLLIPVIGLLGAALATVVAGLTTLAAAALVLRRWFGTRPALQALAVIGFACAVGLGWSTATTVLFPEAGRIVTLLALGGGYGLYLGLLTAGGALTGGAGLDRRVLLVTKPLNPPWNDGAKVLCRDLARHLPPDQIAICVTKGHAATEDWPDGVELIPVYTDSDSYGGRLGQNARMFLFLVLQRSRFRSIHFFFAPHPLACTAIRALRLMTIGVPFVQTILSRPRRFEDAQGLLFGHVVTAGSQDTASQLHARSRGPVQVIRPGIDLARVAPADTAAGPSPAAFHLLFAGDLDHGGALDHLRSMVPLLLDGDARIHFHLSVRQKQSETLARGKELYESLERTHPGRVTLIDDHPRFDELLQMQDAMLFPAEDLYTKIDAPLVVLETLALGKPVFMLDRPPLDEIVPASMHGLLLDRTSEDLVRKVLAHVEDPSAVSASELRQHILDEFDVSAKAAAYWEIHAGLHRR